MSDAIAGHGATIAMESNPTGAPGVFTTIAELNGDIQFPGLNRGETEVTPHDKTIDYYVMGVLRREPLTFSINYIFDDATHDHLTGVQDAILTNEKRGYRLRGPAGTIDTDEWICSGFVTNVTQTNPVRDGARTSDITIRMVGPMEIDGVAHGT